jgi:23S rRNA (guanine2535-N1)-methyltransferase
VKYRFAVQRENYEDLSSGRVLYGQPGSTAFPVRIASEIFQRCAERLARLEAPPLYSLYDPCCGGGYLLTVLGFLHGADLQRIVGSDINAEAVVRARRNLSLLTAAGLERRLEELRGMAEEFGKPSHREAMESGARLRAGLTAAHERIQTDGFPFDITGREPLPERLRPVDLVVSDLPYGRTTAWKGASDAAEAAQALLGKIQAVLAPVAVVALVASKDQAVSHPDYRRVEVWTIGRRRVSLFERAQHRSDLPLPGRQTGDVDRS